MKYTIGTRGSKLALVQANYVCRRLQEAYPQAEFEIKIITTTGDKNQVQPLNQLGTKGVFVKEIEEALLADTIQLAVHSMKDMPSTLPPGLVFSKFWKREDPRDVLILRQARSLAELPQGAVIGTGSRRRGDQLLAIRPDLKVVDIRGNVETRIRKMDEQQLDGIVLAAAGLRRLGMEDRITQILSPEEMIPAPAQGILALETKAENETVLAMLNALADEDTQPIAIAERSFLENMGGDCHTPVGALCTKEADGQFCLSAFFGRADVSRNAAAKVYGTDPALLAAEAAREIRRRMAGRVALVGAGPGNPDYITVRGMELLRQADCIVYDRLASPELLELAKPGCECIYVGKENHHHSMKQENINLLLVAKSMEHNLVVRLKGGDSYVFGRGGEEALVLRAHGVSFEVVPGISSSLAGLTCAGIPITHRGIANGFHVVTGHDQRDKLANLDFDALAKCSETLVFLMGLSKLGEIADKLMQAGMRSTQAAAVISHATMNSQRVCVSDLAHIEAEVHKAGLESPALIVVGDVIALREQLNFFEERPLFGKKILVAKIGAPVSALTRKLQVQGAMAEEIQVGQIRQTPFCPDVDGLARANCLVFTSKNGVHSFFEAFRREHDLRSLFGKHLVAIGTVTAKALETYGLRADAVMHSCNSDALIAYLQEHLAPNSVVWYLKAAVASADLKTAVETARKDVTVEELTVYENLPVASQMEECTLCSYDAICLTCASSAQRLLGAVSQETLAQLNEKSSIYSIGSKTTEALKALGITRMHEADVSTYDGLCSCLEQKLH